MWGWFNADGDELWNYQPPAPTPSAVFAQGDIVPMRESSAGPVVGPDGLIYFEKYCTLYALDLPGRLVWQEPSTAYYDIWVDTYSFW